MLPTKQYDLHKTTKKTATRNNLSTSIYNQGYLFDFSLLEELEDMNDSTKEYIKTHALRYVTIANNNEYYGKEVDNFTCFDGICHFIAHKVYNSNNGKRLYVIMQLENIVHYDKTRQSIYDRYYDVIETKKECGYRCPLYDIELE